MNRGSLVGAPNPKASPFTEIYDRDYRVLTTDRVVLLRTITVARVFTLPSAESFGVGELVVGDASGSESSTKTLTVSVGLPGDLIVNPATAGGDTTLAMNQANTVIRLFSDGRSRWVLTSGGALGGDIGGTLSAPANQFVKGWYSYLLGASMSSPAENDMPRLISSQWVAGATLPASQFPTVQTYTPTLTQSGTVAKTVNTARYYQFGQVVYGWVRLTPTAGGSAGTQVVVGAPVTAAAATQIVGSGIITVAGTQYRCVVNLVSTTTFVLRRTDTTGTGNVGADPSAALASSGDTISFFFMYEAA